MHRIERGPTVDQRLVTFYEDAITFFGDHEVGLS